MNPLQTDDKTPASSWFCQMWVVGRPYTYANDVLLSQLVEGDSEWTRHQEQGDWDLDSIPDHLKKDISDQWLEAGLHEHASVASFNRQGIALMANGGPAKLVGDALTGALDEIDHAKRSFAIGSGVGGRSFGPGPFPEHQNAHYFNLTHLALTTLEEGGVGETRAAARAAFQAKVSVHPGLRANYEQIRDDEAGHAATAWQTISWAVQQEPSMHNKLRTRYAQLRVVNDGLNPDDFAGNDERVQYGLMNNILRDRIHGEAQSLMDDVAARAFSGKLDTNSDQPKKEMVGSVQSLVCICCRCCG